MDITGHYRDITTHHFQLPGNPAVIVLGAGRWLRDRLWVWEVFFQEMKNRGRKFHGISGNFHFQRKFPFPGWSGARPPTASTGSEAARPAPRRHVPVAVFRALGRTPRSPPPAGLARGEAAMAQVCRRYYSDYTTSSWPYFMYMYM